MSKKEDTPVQSNMVRCAPAERCVDTGDYGDAQEAAKMPEK